MKQKLIIIEGADGSGKSTLVESLASMPTVRRCNINWRDDKRIDIDPYEKLPMVLNLIEHFDNRFSYVFDRLILSDIIYNSVLGRPEISRESEYVKVLKKLAANHDVVFVIMDRSKIYHDFRDGKISITKDKFNLIVDRYRNSRSLLQESGIERVLVRTKLNALDSLKEVIAWHEMLP